MSDDQADLNLLWVALLVEGSLLILALLIGQLNFFDHTQPLADLSQADWGKTALWGVLVTFPMLAYLGLFHFWRPAFYQPMRSFVTKHLQPMFAKASVWELLIISIMAGIGEEIFFRWCLQGGAFSTLEPWIGWGPAIAVSLALTSLLFGTCHWVNTTYFVFATFAGLYFGAVMVWTESWPVAAIGHALFDFAALMYIKALPRNTEESTNDPAL